jgi:hypothetical protein
MRCCVTAIALILSLPVSGLVLAAQDTTIALPPAAVKVTSSNNPSSYGDPVDITASFAEGTTGTVVFKDGTRVLGEATINWGVANYRTSQLELGSHVIWAEYGGDPDHGPSAGSMQQVVHQADPNVVLFCSPNTSIYVDELVCTATLPADATGEVIFLDDVTELGTSEPVDGIATFILPRLNVGTHLITASYGGDENYRPSHGRQTQTILQADSNLAVHCLPNPVWLGQALTCVAEAPVDAKGSVVFTAGWWPAKRIKLVNGVAVWDTTPMAAGDHTISVAYKGDINYRGSRSSTQLTVVDPDALTQ